MMRHGGSKNSRNTPKNAHNHRRKRPCLDLAVRLTSLSMRVRVLSRTGTSRDLSDTALRHPPRAAKLLLAHCIGVQGRRKTPKDTYPREYILVPKLQLHLSQGVVKRHLTSDAHTSPIRLSIACIPFRRGLRLIMRPGTSPSVPQPAQAEHPWPCFRGLYPRGEQRINARPPQRAR